MAELNERYVREVLDGTGWQVSELLGSMGKTRLARRGGSAVAVKLVDTPLAILTRLSDLGVTPPVLASGSHEGHRYVVQQVVSGPSPDHAWFAANVEPWADLVRRYLQDEPLRGLVAAAPAFWRLSVPDAVAMLDWEHIDLSDPRRDVGYQAWGFLPQRLWNAFLRGVGLPTADEHGIHWWAAFKVAGTAFWLDSRSDEGGAAFHAELFQAAAARRPWVD